MLPLQQKGINAQHFNIEAKILNNDPGGSKQADVIVDVIGYFYP